MGVLIKHKKISYIVTEFMSSGVLGCRFTGVKRTRTFKAAGLKHRSQVRSGHRSGHRSGK